MVPEAQDGRGGEEGRKNSRVSQAKEIMAFFPPPPPLPPPPPFVTRQGDFPHFKQRFQGGGAPRRTTFVMFHTHVLCARLGEPHLQTLSNFFAAHTVLQTFFV